MPYDPESIESTAKSSRRKQPMYRTMMDVIRERITRGDLSPGDSAPSESDLIIEFQVSSATARRCLNELAQLGLVRRIQGRGTFVTHQAVERSIRQVGILYFGLTDLTTAFSANLLKGVHRTLSDSPYHPSLIDLSPIQHSAQPAAALSDLVRRSKLEGLLVINPVPRPWLDEVLEDGIPVGAINFRYDDPRISVFIQDSQAGLDRMAEAFRDLGHGRVVVVHKRFDRRLMQGVGYVDFGTVREGWTEATVALDQKDYAREVVERYMGGQDPPTVFLAVGYEVALDLRHAIKARGLTIPGDVSLVYLGAPPGPSEMHGEVPPIARLSGRAAEVLLDRMSGAVYAEQVFETFATYTMPGKTLGPAKPRRA